MPDPVTNPNNQRPAARITGVRAATDPEPSKTPSAPDFPAPALLPSNIRSMFPGVPTSLNEAKAMLPEPSITLNSKNTAGVPVGLEVFAKYRPTTNTGVAWASYLRTVETPYVTLASDIFVVNRFNGRGTNAGGSIEASGNGNFDFLRGGVTFEVGKENKVAATAVVADLLKLDYTRNNGLSFSAIKSIVIPLGDEKTGPVLSFDLNMGVDGKGKRVNGGANLGIKR